MQRMWTKTNHARVEKNFHNEKLLFILYMIRQQEIKIPIFYIYIFYMIYIFLLRKDISIM